MFDVSLRPSPYDSELARCLKELLIYGDHRHDCEGVPPYEPGTQHECCKCDWCVIHDSADMALSFETSRIQQESFMDFMKTLWTLSGADLGK